MARTVGRLNDWTTSMTVEQGWNLTHIILQDRNNTAEIELNKEKVKELIKILENAIR